jgi:8-oxo-dGTP pyrophosphatase MutT (NUDIX family)
VTAANDEMVEVLDAAGAVTGLVTRAEMRRGNLRHRSAYVVVRSQADGGARVLAHRRADWKDVWPGRWDLAFGGVCSVGEDWGQAARRELAEEAGVQGELRPLGEGTFASAEVQVQGRIFEARHDGPFVLADGEVTEVGWVPLGGLADWVAGRPVCPDTLALVLPLLR